MSSPLHSLKKNKIPLYPGHMTGNRPIPFRHPEYSDDEKSLLEEITTQVTQEHRKKNMYFPHLNLSNSQTVLKKPESSRRDFSPEKKNEATSPPSDFELMKLMINRVALLEQKTQSQESEIKAKDRQIKILEDKLQILEKARKENTTSNEVKDLETHCLLLKQQVHEMETFLADYGMVWVGESTTLDSNVYLRDSIDEDDDENNNVTEISIRSDSPGNSIASSNPFGIWRQDLSLPVAPIPLNIDFNLLIENIKDLNVLAGEGVAKIKKTADGARFEIPDPVQLTIYANGILMYDGPFRPYTDPTTRQCVQDLLDGYFPTELQKRYPDGVPFVVTDLRGTYFQPKKHLLAFAGEGQTLGDKSSESVITTSRLPNKPLTQAQFLHKIPKSVVRDGKIIDIRDSIQKTLLGNDDSYTKPTVTPVISVSKSISDTAQNADRSKSATKLQGDITTLRVKAENGSDTYIVKMLFTETVGDLRKHLDSLRRPKVPYDIVTTFPFKIHKNNTLSLEDSGLTPTAVLHLKPHREL
ncbi:UBX domain-containing protein 11-like isoform X2 [Physella acuta]|uniref:UBX domain-containing protein 11-like isoform X2 n=1 Tax=Physella acuta TaxID=109671 RepID=UPI0027DE2F95|nr:UBX domain-containing protein 11-like isoform X2 [Physella acuta]